MVHQHDENCDHDHEPSDNPFAGLDEETQREIQEIQMLEQSFQQIIMQKQAFQYESTETNNALEEVKKAEGDVFKIVGNQVVIKTSKEKVEKELTHKRELIDLRLTNIDKQEAEFSKRIEELREKIMKKISNK